MDYPSKSLSSPIIFKGLASATHSALGYFLWHNNFLKAFWVAAAKLRACVLINIILIQT